jgi:acetyl-CoA carboxylase carboxyl transferase subunit beta
VDRVVGEYPDAADEPEPFLRRLGAVLEAELATLLRQAPTAQRASRRRRYRCLGLV